MIFEMHPTLLLLSYLVVGLCLWTRWRIKGGAGTVALKRGLGGSLLFPQQIEAGGKGCRGSRYLIEQMDDAVL